MLQLTALTRDIWEKTYAFSDQLQNYFDLVQAWLELEPKWLRTSSSAGQAPFAFRSSRLSSFSRNSCTFSKLLVFVYQQGKLLVLVQQGKLLVLIFQKKLQFRKKPHLSNKASGSSSKSFITCRCTLHPASESSHSLTLSPTHPAFLLFMEHLHTSTKLMPTFIWGFVRRV